MVIGREEKYVRKREGYDSINRKRGGYRERYEYPQSSKPLRNKTALGPEP